MKQAHSSSFTSDVFFSPSLRGLTHDGGRLLGVRCADFVIFVSVCS
jgi:hypothetical protein